MVCGGGERLGPLDCVSASAQSGNDLGRRAAVNPGRLLLPTFVWLSQKGPCVARLKHPDPGAMGGQ